MNAKQGVIAHTQVQYDMFLRWHNLPRENFYRIREMRDAVCRTHALPVLILPDGRAGTQGFHEILEYLQARGATVEWLTEDQAREGRAEVKTNCPFDSNKDGDCHLCARKGGCRWPVSL